MDVKIKQSGYNFKYRVAGLIVNGDKILTCEIMNNGFLCLPGGHCHIGEDSITAILREIYEEVGVQVEIVQLKCLIENFFKTKTGEECHELSFIYELKPIDLPEEKQKDWTIVENDDGIDKELKFKWIKKSEIANFDVRPRVIKDLVNTNRFKHILVKDETILEV
jgi:ADP-ribose pyrophosphatase YjhB (NUDIX family)